MGRPSNPPLTIDGQDPPDSLSVLPAGTERRAGRWYARQPEVPEHLDREEP
jgi:hypothetical protein